MTNAYDPDGFEAFWRRLGFKDLEYGVYIMSDAQGRALYVGKTHREGFRDRIRQHYRKTDWARQEVDKVESSWGLSEHEAFQKEQELTERLHPKYNSPFKRPGKGADLWWVDGEKLKRYRDQQQLSVEELAGQAGLSVNSITDPERLGSKKMTSHTIHKLADALNVETVALHFGDDSATPEVSSEDTLGPPALGDDHGSPTDIPTQIQKIAELRAAGVLTEDEFQTSKRRLIDRL